MKRLFFPKFIHHSCVSHYRSQKFKFSAIPSQQNFKNHGYWDLLTNLDTKSLHGFVITLGSFPRDDLLFLLNNIMSKYAAMGDIDMARKGYANKGSSFPILEEMIQAGYCPNEMSFSTVIKSSLKGELLQLHSMTIKMGHHENPYVLSSLISSYARNGLIYDALTFVGYGNSNLTVVSTNVVAWIYNRTGQYEKTQELYALLKDPDTISWNILIAACSRNGDYKETFQLFDQMRRSQVCPDNYTFVSLFSVCAKLCSLALGSSLHGLLLRTNINLCDTFVCNTMIDMYGKCGDVESSMKIFADVVEKNAISWTGLLSALGLNGYAKEALEMFQEMEGMGVEPDKVTFLAVLSACRHVGLVKQGMNLFNKMKQKYGVEPDIDHYLIVVDLLTKYGHIKEAEQLILGMPMAPNALIWRSFLQGCKKLRNKIE